MGKEQKTQPARTPEREALAAAIAQRDEAEAREATLAKATERAKADRFLAGRDVEDAQRVLDRAREAAREALVDTYAFMGSEGDDAAQATIAEAERTLAAAQRRLSDLRMVEQELSARSGPAPGRSIPSTRVDAAIRAVVKAHPTVRRLITDFDTARRAFQQYHSTLRWLAAHDCIPDDLKNSAPKAHDTYHAEPDPTWKAALAALGQNPDAELPG